MKSMMIYNYVQNTRLDDFNLVYPKNSTNREFYDSFSIERPNALKFKTLDNSRKGFDFIATYNDMKWGGNNKQSIYKPNRISTTAPIINNLLEKDEKIAEDYANPEAKEDEDQQEGGGKSIRYPLSRPGYKGERHLFANDFKTKFNYCGPYTKLISRLKRNDQGIDRIDEQCKKHDIDYLKARTLSDVRKADEKLINSLNNIRGHDPVKTIIKLGMKAKQVAHKVGLPENTFTGRNILSDGKNLKMSKQDEKDIKVIKQMGYGKKKKKKKMLKNRALKLKLKKMYDPIEKLRQKI